MAGAKELNQLGLDWANGKLTLLDMLWEAYAYGYSDGDEDAKSE